MRHLYAQAADELMKRFRGDATPAMKMLPQAAAMSCELLWTEYDVGSQTVFVPFGHRALEQTPHDHAELYSWQLVVKGQAYIGIRCQGFVPAVSRRRVTITMVAKPFKRLKLFGVPCCIWPRRRRRGVLARGAETGVCAAQLKDCPFQSCVLQQSFGCVNKVVAAMPLASLCASRLFRPDSTGIFAGYFW